MTDGGPFRCVKIPAPSCEDVSHGSSSMRLLLLFNVPWKWKDQRKSLRKTPRRSEEWGSNVWE